ncbi:hypothetical protein ONZ45_g10686 [Pleurotus djamor]|nr:hypothetical protein ONZ45_g10686 [Pleurotus djamor]
MARSKERKQLIDDSLSASANILRLAEGPSALTPVPGLSVVISTLLMLVETVQRTRSNSVECLQLARSLGSLVGFLNATLEKIQKQIKDDPSTDPQIAAANLERSQDLSDRVNRLLKDIHNILDEAQGLSKGSSLRRFFRSGDDESALQSLNTQVQQAQSRFHLQGTISIEMVVNQLIKTVEMDKLERKIPQALELERELTGIRTVDAGYMSPIHSRKRGWLEGTRVKLLRNIMSWSEGRRTDDFREDSQILILAGGAGTGKSTIAAQVSQVLEKEGALAGSFFFERGLEDLSSTRLVFSSLAVQLARYHKTLAPIIAEGIRKHRQNGNVQHLSYALDELIIEPWSKVPRDQWPSRPIVFVLDAIDACNEPDQISSMLYLLLKRTRTLAFPLRFFLTTRHEDHIHDVFASADWKSEPKPYELGDIPTDVLNDDICRFIRARLTEAGIAEPLEEIQDNAVEKLTIATGGLFIYAATCVEFLIRYRDDLRKILDLLLNNPLNVDSLKILYNVVLIDVFPNTNSHHPDLGPSVQSVIGALVVLQEQLPPKSLSTLLRLKLPVLNEVLDRLSPVVTLTGDQLVHLHDTFPRSLIDPTKCQLPNIDGNPSFLGHDSLAKRCLEALLDEGALRRNICDLPDPLVFRNDIQKLDTLLMNSIPAHVRYACLHWSSHLSNSAPSQETARLLKGFAEKKMLAWLEVLGMLGQVDVAVSVFSRVLEWYKIEDSTRALLKEGQRFLWTFIDCIRICPFQVYVSGLAFSPSKSLLREVYARQADDLPIVDMLAGQDETWGPCLRVFEGHQDRIQSAGFSCDGRLIASAGAYGGDIKIWDAASGALLRTLSSEAYKVAQCIFSSDGKFVVSASEKTVRIWDATSGISLNDFDLAGDISGMALSPVSPGGGVDRIAVALESGDIQIVDTDGRMLRAFAKVSKSPIIDWSTEAKYLAITDEKKVIIYDTKTYSAPVSLVGHTDTVFAVKIVPQSDLIVSGSRDSTVRLWKIKTQECVYIFEGHTFPVCSIGIDSSNGIVASGSSDNTIRLWSLESKACLAVLSGQSDTVTSLSFSPSGDELLSGGWDGSLKLWDAKERSASQAPNSSRKRVPEWTLSPDGQFIATRLDGNVIVDLWSLNQDRHLWSIPRDDGAVMVSSVAGSPDGTWVATLRNESTDIRLSNILTGETHSINKNDFHGLGGYRWWEDKLRGVSADGRLIYAGSYGDRWRVLDWKARRVNYVDIAEIPPEHIDATDPHKRFIIQDGWLVDQQKGTKLCWIPSAYRIYRGELSPSAWTFYHDGQSAKWFLVNDHTMNIIVLDLKVTKTSSRKQGADTAWQPIYRCLRKVLLGVDE